MDDSVRVALTLLGAYLLGSFPTGFLAGRLKGVDLRLVGSGNIGATNAVRALGKPMGASVLLIDALKGAAACGWFPVWLARLAGAETAPEWLRLAAGVAAVLGHNFTPWLRFRGGKGVAASAGVMLTLAPAAFGICLGIWLAAFAAWRYVSLASILAAISLAPAIWLAGGSRLMVGAGVVLGAMALWRHRENMRRLLAGTEPRISSKGGGRASHLEEKQ